MKKFLQETSTGRTHRQQGNTCPGQRFALSSIGFPRGAPGFAEPLSFGLRQVQCLAGWHQLRPAQGRPWPLLTQATPAGRTWSAVSSSGPHNSKKRRRPTGEGPKEGRKDDQRAGEPALGGKAEGVGSLLPCRREGSRGREPHRSLPVLKGRLQRRGRRLSHKRSDAAFKGNEGWPCFPMPVSLF